MQAKHGRAGKHKRYQRAAVLALTVLLIILLAGRVLPVCAGTPVLAALDGVVTAARRGAAYGNYVRLTHGDGQETLYAHMQYLYVRAGEVVAAGQRLGTAGQTGRATGAHLHFEFLTGGIRYDPSAALSLP